MTNGSEKKKEKGTRKCVIQRKLKFEDHKNCLEVTQLQNKIKHLEHLKKNEINVNSVKKDYKEFM